MGGIDGRDRAGADLQPAPRRTATSSRAAGTTPTTRGSGTCPLDVQVIVMPPTTAAARRRRRARRRAVDGGRRVRVRAGDRHDADELPDQPQRAARLHAATRPSRRSRSRPTDGLTTRTKESRDAHPHLHPQRQAGHASTATTTSALLWVLRDLLGVTGPKYGCGLDVCKACTSHINGKAFNPCSVRSRTSSRPTRSPRSRASPATVGKDLHPMQQAWLDYDVAQCGYCQPGQIMDRGRARQQVQAQGRDDHRRRPRSDPQRLPLRDLLRASARRSPPQLAACSAWTNVGSARRT